MTNSLDPASRSASAYVPEDLGQPGVSDALKTVLKAVQQLPALQSIIAQQRQALEEERDAVRYLRQAVALSEEQRKALEDRVNNLVGATGLLGNRIDEQSRLVREAEEGRAAADRRVLEVRGDAAAAQLQAVQLRQGLQQEVDRQKQLLEDRLAVLLRLYEHFKTEEETFLQAWQNYSISGVFAGAKFITGELGVAAEAMTIGLFPQFRLGWITSKVELTLTKDGARISAIRREIREVCTFLGREPPRLRTLKAEKLYWAHAAVSSP
jgi:hypothetical protein